MLFSKSNLIILCSLISTTSAFAEEVVHKAIIRGRKFRPHLQEVKLDYLQSKDSFDGKYFKIVLDKPKDLTTPPEKEPAISFNDPDKDLVLKASNTYFHLNKARDYWVNQVRSDYVRNLPKIIVRLNIKNKFSELGHFEQEWIEPQTNNALSIPPGKQFVSTDKYGNPVPILGPDKKPVPFAAPPI